MTQPAISLFAEQAQSDVEAARRLESPTCMLGICAVALSCTADVARVGAKRSRGPGPF
jgi:hypothetical protein